MQNNIKLYFRGASFRQVFPLRQADNQIERINNESRQQISIIDDVGRINKGKLGDRMKSDGDCFTLNTIEQRGIMIDVYNKKFRNECPTLTDPCHNSIRVADFRNDEGLRIRDESVSPYLASRKHSESDISTMSPIIIYPTLSTELAHSTGRDFFRNSGIKIHKASNQIRRLTPIECERLQGFEDNWTIGSDTQRYKQCGNAVTTNVIQAIVEEMILKSIPHPPSET